MADVDMALGAADTTPPATSDRCPGRRPATAASTSRGRQPPTTSLVPAYLRYRVYRWPDPTPIRGSTNYTPVPVLAATTATAYADDESSTAPATTTPCVPRTRPPTRDRGRRRPTPRPTAHRRAPSTALVATPATDRSTLSWTNPGDPDLAEVASAAVKERRPRRRQTASPSTAAQGRPATTVGLTNGTTYTYAVFARDTVGNWSDRRRRPMPSRASSTGAFARHEQDGRRLWRRGHALRRPERRRRAAVRDLLEVESSSDSTDFRAPADAAGPTRCRLPACHPVDKTWYRLHSPATRPMPPRTVRSSASPRGCSLAARRRPARSARASRSSVSAVCSSLITPPVRAASLSAATDSSAVTGASRSPSLPSTPTTRPTPGIQCVSRCRRPAAGRSAPTPVPTPRHAATTSCRANGHGSPTMPARRAALALDRRDRAQARLPRWILQSGGGRRRGGGGSRRSLRPLVLRRRRRRATV